MFQARIPSSLLHNQLLAEPAWVALQTLNSQCNRLEQPQLPQEWVSLKEDDGTLPSCRIWGSWRGLLLRSIASEGSSKGINSCETHAKMHRILVLLVILVMCTS